jgi:hypothetical protein
MTISSPTFQRLQSGIKAADDLRVKEPINAMMAWLSGNLVTQLNTHFGAVSTSISNAISIYASTKPAFLAHKNGTNQDSISATQTPITFSTEDIDIGGHFASDAWTPPAGRVRLTANIEWSPLNAVDNELLSIHIRKNGSAIRTHATGRAGTNFTTQTISTLDNANGTDAYSVSAQKGGAGDGRILGATTATWFCGEAV